MSNQKQELFNGINPTVDRRGRLPAAGPVSSDLFNVHTIIFSSFWHIVWYRKVWMAMLCFHLRRAVISSWLRTMASKAASSISRLSGDVPAISHRYLHFHSLWDFYAWTKKKVVFTFPYFWRQREESRWYICSRARSWGLGVAPRSPVSRIPWIPTKSVWEMKVIAWTE